MTLPEKILDVAKTQIGVREHGVNGGDDIAKYQRATWLPVGAWPWCAAFVDWCVAEAVTVLGKPITFALPRTAGAWDLENWCLSVDNSAILKRGCKSVAAGDIVIYKFSHTGIAASATDEKGFFKTIEGNTNDAGSREGDGVYFKTRHISQVRSRIRFKG